MAAEGDIAGIPQPSGAAAAPIGKPGPVQQRAGSLQFIGNATTIIRYGDLTLLTDPNFLHRGQRAYLGNGLVSKRLHDPALRVDELPPLDAILLSHMHGDHWDRVAQRGLDHDLPIITTADASKRLQRRGFLRATGLRTWGRQTLFQGSTMVAVTAMPGRHAPGIVQRLLPPVMGSMLEFGPLDGTVELRLYISGDTLVIDDLKQIPVRYPDIDTGVFHLGGTTLPGGLMVTMDGKQGADLMELVAPRTVVPVHFDDYSVMRSPLSDFKAEVDRRGIGDRVRYVERGQTIELPGSATPVPPGPGPG
jgi:L-ascorbate metabolism protein UlaG (beta-lactamase superfamily)